VSRTEIDLIRRALDLLHRLVPDDEPRPITTIPQRGPVSVFAKRYLTRDPASDLTCAELWQFFGEVSASGEVGPLSKSEFLRRLPTALEEIFNVRKCHNVERDGQRLRGFRGVGIRVDASPVTTLELEPG
jgi:hypothetical protein